MADRLPSLEHLLSAFQQFIRQQDGEDDFSLEFQLAARALATGEQAQLLRALEILFQSAWAVGLVKLPELRHTSLLLEALRVLQMSGRPLPKGMPTLMEIEQIWHIGTLILAQKQPDSHAGRGVAVSAHPQAWCRIAKLAGPLLRLEKNGALFADAHACLRNPQVMGPVWMWARAEQYVTWQPLHHVTYYDSETGEWRTLVFAEESQALREYQALQQERAWYDVRPGYAPLERMRVAMEHTELPLAFAADFALFLFLEACAPFLDGVWWADEYRPEVLSAPHGALFRHQLPSWRRSQEEDEGKA